MRRKDNIIKVPNMHSGIVFYFILVLLIIYFVAYIVTYMSKPHLSIYEVVRENLSIETTVTGVVVREEEVYYSDKAGYINYYYRDGTRVKKSANIYSIDENKTVYDALEDSGSTLKLDEASIIEIKNRISEFRQEFSEGDYSLVKDFKQEITGSIQEMADENLRNNLADVLSETGLSSSFDAVSTDKSGVITYYVDSLDGLTADIVNSSTFNVDNFTVKSARTDLCEAGDKVYKLVTSNTWYVVVLLTDEIYDEIADKSTVNITIVNDGLNVTVPVETYITGGQKYAKLTFTNYLTKYLSKRFLEIEFSVSGTSGLKIPESAITEKEFFLIPKEYFTYGSATDEDAYGLLVVSYDEETMEPVYVFTETEIYYEDDTYAYVDTDQFTVNTFVYNMQTEERLRMSMIGKLEGVYNVNKGYALFRRIEIIEKKDGYYIIKENTNNGVVLYDHLALDADTAVEAAIIY